MKLYVMTNDEAMDIWTKEFPILSKYNASTVFAKSDIMLIGLRFYWSRPSFYEVALEFVPLWTDWQGVDHRVLHLYLRPPRQYNVLVGYTENNRALIQGLELAHNQFGLFLKKEVSLKDLLQLNEEMKILGYKEHWSLKNDPLIISSYLRLKMALASFSGNTILINRTIQQILDVTKKWDDERLEFLYGITLEEWKRKVFSMSEDRESFMQQIEINKTRPRIAKLKSIQITGLDILAEDIPELNETIRMKLSNAMDRFYRRHILEH